MKRLGLLPLLLLLLAACTTLQEPTSPVPDAAASSIAASKTATDLGQAVKVTVTLKSSEGEAVSKSPLPVAFYADGGTLGSAGKVAAIAPAAAGSMVIEPNAEGAASVFINSDVDGVITVTAYLGSDDSGEQIGQIQVTFGAGDEEPDGEEPAEEPAPSAAASAISASRLKTATGAIEVVTVQLNDASGEPLALADARVTFTTDEGRLSADGENFGDPSEALGARTDANGTASVFVTSDTDRTVAVTAYLYADASAPEIGSVEITFASVALNDLTVTYDGQPHALVAEFSDEAAAVDAVYKYVRESDEQVFTSAPVDAGVYSVTVEAGGGFPGSAAATLTIETREIAFDGEVVFSAKAYDGESMATAVATLQADDIAPGDDVALITPLLGEFQTLEADGWVASSQVGVYPNDGSSRVVGKFELTGDDAHNYFISQPTGAAAISVKEIAFAADVSVESKQYDGTVTAAVTGDFDPAPVAGEDVTFVGQFASPDAGTDVAVNVTLAGADAHKYTLAPTALSADITPLPLTITAGDRSKVYGDALELGSTDFAVEGLLEGEGIDSVSLSSAGATDVAFAGTFDVTASDAVAAVGTLLSNYVVTYVPGTLSVSPRDLIIVPDDGQGKTYGDTDPSFTFASSGLVNGDTLDGSLARVAGEDAGQYDFELGSLAVIDGNEGGNYVLAIEDGAAPFLIAAREIVVTASSDQAKTYGDDDPVLAYSLTEGSLADGDAFTGAIGREPGEDVGGYAFTLGDLSVADGNAGGNYVIALEASDSFVIGVRTVTIGGSMVPADRPYDGTTDAQIVVNELVLLNAIDGDDVAIQPVIAFDDRHVADGKDVTFTDATSLIGEDAGNYLLDLTGAPSATARITKAQITFDITNKDSLTYTGLALGLVTVTDPAPAPDSEPVAYNLQYRRIATPAGETIDEGVGAILEAGQYRVTVTASDPRYVGSDEIIVTVGARPITLTSNVTSKVFGEADPELPPLLADGSTLGSGDSVTGLLGFNGSDAGTYELGMGTVALMNAGEDVTENYAVTVAGTFTIHPAPVSFDITNFDFSVEGVHVFQRDGSAIVGFVVASDPVGMNDYALSYRRTHDAAHQPIPAAQQAVSTVRALGTYVVTIESTNGNYVGSTDRVVWLTHGLDLSGGLPSGGEEGEPFSLPLLIGEIGQASVPFANAEGSLRPLGPVPVTFELSVDPASGLEFLDPQTGDQITSVSVAPGGTGVEFDLAVSALGAAPYTVTITPTGPLASLIGGVSFQVVAEAELHVVDGDVTVGQDANSPVVSVQLRDSKGAPVEAPTDVAIALVGDEGLSFVSATTDEVVEGVVIPGGSTSANFRVRSTTPGQYLFHVENDSSVPGVLQSDAQTATVNPKPTVASVDPAGIQIGQTTQLTIDGADFASGATVLIAGLVVSDVTVESPTRITVTATATFGEVDTGQVAIEVTNPDGGKSVLDAGLDVVKPTLSAMDDVLNIVEGGSIDLPKATLMSNDIASSGLDFSLIGFSALENVTIVDEGATLRVTSTGLMGQGAAFDYTIEDVLGTPATGTVTFNITLPPQDAVVFTERADLEAYTAGYAPPTVQEVFNTWPRASNNNYFANPSSATGSADQWYYDAGKNSFVQPDNTSTHEVIVSPPDEALEYYTFEATLTSSDSDDDSIGLVIAFVNDGGNLKYLVAHRTQGGLDPKAGWGITYFENGTPKEVLTNVSVGAVSNAWSGKQSRVRIVRNGDVATAWVTPWNDLANFQAPMVIDFNANTINGTAVPAGVDLSVFKGERQYGYYTLSQRESTYLDVTVAGGLARDIAYLLTGAADLDDAAGDDTWSGSEVWQFNTETLGWEIQVGRTIQDDLRFPRVVTSVAPIDPSDPDSAEIGTRFEVREFEVVLLSEQP